MAKDTKKMSVYLSQDQYNYVNSWAKMAGVGRSQFIQTAINAFVGDLQARYNERLRQLLEDSQSSEVQDNEQRPRVNEE